MTIESRTWRTALPGPIRPVVVEQTPESVPKLVPAPPSPASGSCSSQSGHGGRPLFLDKVHGQDGVAPNGAEIHPYYGSSGGWELRLRRDSAVLSVRILFRSQMSSYSVEIKSGIRGPSGGRTLNGAFFCTRLAISSPDLHLHETVRIFARR